MLSKKDYEEMVQTLKNGESVSISGFKAVVELIFDHALDSLPILSESKYKVAYERDFWGQTWMASPYEGSPKEVQASLMNNVNPLLERERFNIKYVLSESDRVLKERGIKYEEAIEHILLLMDIPNGLDTIARIYKTELGVRAIPNKARIRSN